MITEKDINKFKKLYFEKFAESLNDKEAYQKLSKLVSLVELVGSTSNESS